MLKIKSKPRSSRRKLIIVGTNSFNNIKEAAEFYGVSYETVRSRLKRGKSIEDAILCKVNSYKGLDIIIHGVQYPSVIAACNSLNMSYNVVTRRLKKLYSRRGI